MSPQGSLTEELLRHHWHWPKECKQAGPALVADVLSALLVSALTFMKLRLEIYVMKLDRTSLDKRNSGPPRASTRYPMISFTISPRISVRCSLRSRCR